MGYTSNYSDTIEYVTIANTGNVTDFGNLTEAKHNMLSVCSNLRGIFAGGSSSSGNATIATMDYVTIASAGNASDFGDLSAVTLNGAGCSGSHGGIAA